MFYPNNSIKFYYKEILVVVLLIAASLPTILWMFDRWFDKDSYYSHGILVPFVSLFLVWAKRDVIKELPLESSLWGLRLFIFGIILYWISALLHVYFSSGFSMIIVTAGLVLHFYGKKVLKEVTFPLLFLIFMVPLPLVVVAYICFKLKIIASLLATVILNTMGFQAIQQSSLIKMSHCYILVDDSCGGLRSLISLTALGSIFAYRLKSSFFNKMFLFLSSVLIATIANACRIVFLSAISEIWGTEYAQGPVHNISGYLVFVFTFLLLFVFKRFLGKYKTI